MTENNFGKNYYWLLAIFISLIPLIIIYALLGLLQNVFGLNTSHINSMYYIIWLASYILAVILIKKPYQHTFRKYNWDYNGEVLSNTVNNVHISNSEIESIFIGYDKRNGIAYWATKLANRKLKYFLDTAKKYSLVMKLTHDRVIFLNLAMLKNGHEVQEKLLEKNIEKIQKEPFLVSNMNKTKIKFYKVLSIK